MLFLSRCNLSNVVYRSKFICGDLHVHEVGLNLDSKTPKTDSKIVSHQRNAKHNTITSTKFNTNKYSDKMHSDILSSSELESIEHRCEQNVTFLATSNYFTSD